MIRALSCLFVTGLVTVSAYNAPIWGHGEEWVAKKNGENMTAPASCILGTQNGCDTSVASGLTNQIISQLKSMGYSFTTLDPTWIHCSSSCSLQSGAASSLVSAAKSKNDYITLNSAFRSSAQQYMLYNWYNKGICGIGLAATPGTSNHEGGRAIVDVTDAQDQRVEAPPSPREEEESTPSLEPSDENITYPLDAEIVPHAPIEMDAPIDPHLDVTDLPHAQEQRVETSPEEEAVATALTQFRDPQFDVSEEQKLNLEPLNDIIDTLHAEDEKTAPPAPIKNDTPIGDSHLDVTDLTNAQDQRVEASPSPGEEEPKPGILPSNKDISCPPDAEDEKIGPTSPIEANDSHFDHAIADQEADSLKIEPFDDDLILPSANAAEEGAAMVMALIDSEVQIDFGPTDDDVTFPPCLDIVPTAPIEVNVPIDDPHFGDVPTLANAKEPKKKIEVTPAGTNRTLPFKVSPDQRVSDFIESLSSTEAKGSLTLVNSAGEYVDPAASLSCSGNSFELQRVTGVWRNEQRVTLRPELCSEMRDKFEILRASTIKILQENPATLPTSPQETLSFGTLCHCLSHMLSSKNKEVLLFDSTDASNPFFQTVVDQGHQISRLEERDVDIISFRFEDLSPIGSQTSLEEYLQSSSLETVKQKFVEYFCVELRMPAEKVSQMEIVSGSVIVNLNAESWSLDDRNNFIALGSKIPATTVTIHPLFKSCTIDISIFDKRGDKTDFHGLNFSLGPKNQKQTYFQPLGGHGWTRFGLDVLGKYSDGDGWLKPFSSPENWWRAYHGTSMQGVEGILKNGAKDGMIRDSLGGKLSKGVYVTPHLEYAACYSQPCEFGNRKYILLFQCAVKPGSIEAQGYPGSNSFREYPGLSKIFHDRYKDKNSEWSVPSQCVRPYGILVGDVEKLEEIYGKDAVGNRKRGGGGVFLSSRAPPPSQSLGSRNQVGETNVRPTAQPLTQQSAPQGKPAVVFQQTKQPPQPSPMPTQQPPQSAQQACCHIS